MNPGYCAALFLAFTLSACGSSPPPDPNNPGSTSTNSNNDDPSEGKHDDSATLDVVCAPPAEVKIDGTSVGKSPINQHKVPPGSHDITCVDEETGPQTMTYVLEPGEGRGVTINRIPRAVDQAPEPSATPAAGKKPPKK